MGTGQSKSSPDVQMRMKMENRFDDDDEESVISQFGVPGRGGKNGGDPTRSQSNFSRHATSERLGNEDDEYFNNIYDKRVEKSLITVGGVKSAPAVGNKKEKDPEVAAAIAELEETFKVLEDPPMQNGGVAGITNGLGLGGNGILSTEEINKRVPQTVQHSNQTGSSSSVEDVESSGYDPTGSHDDSPYSSSDSSMSVNYNRQLISGDVNCSDVPRRNSKFLDINRTQVDSNDLHYPAHSSSSSNSQINMSTTARSGTEQRFLVSSYGSVAKHGKNLSYTHNPQSVLMQQRKEFQNQRRNGNDSNFNSSKNNRQINKQEQEKDWTYQPPKIDGFDVDKFKEVNSKVAPSAIVILREEEDKGYYSQSPDVPSYTKDELDLIASLERDTY